MYFMALSYKVIGTISEYWLLTFWSVRADPGVLGYEVRQLDFIAKFETFN